MNVNPSASQAPRLLAIVLLLGLGLFSGCTTLRAIKVAARAREPLSPGTSYVIAWQSGTERKDAGLREEVGQMVKAVLATRGLREAPDRAGADIIILLRYGTTRESREASISFPPLRNEGIVRPTPGTDGSVSYPAASSVSDSEPLPAPIRRSEDYFILSAQKGGRLEGLPVGFIWRVESKRDHAKGDLRDDIPRLVAAALDHVGQDWSGFRWFSGNKYERTLAAVSKDH